MSRIDVVLDGVVRYSAAVMTNKEEQQHHPQAAAN
jgi:NaMN:DMB phosphoribosyltransferase